MENAVLSFADDNLTLMYAMCQCKHHRQINDRRANECTVEIDVNVANCILKYCSKSAVNINIRSTTVITILVSEVEIQHSKHFRHKSRYNYFLLLLVHFCAVYYAHFK